MADFQLSKWYLDCVAEPGDASIVYTGQVHWGPLRLHYSSILESAAGRVAFRRALRRQPEPLFDNGTLRWNCRALKSQGEWQAESEEVRETVFASEAGSIEWRCLMPRALAWIDGRAGLGYAEQLSMTIAPWKLPIATLRWGRFLAASDWVVWIDWLGGFTRRIVYWNGCAVSGPTVEDDAVELGGGARLGMDRATVLREGAIGATALDGIPGLRDTVPAQLLRVRECKWLSRGRLERPGQPAVEGWVVHERVDWPR